MAQFEAFSSRHMSDPGQVLVNDTSRRGSQSDEGASVSLRVYAANALVSPGTLYKAVVATPSTTAVDVSLKVFLRWLGVYRCEWRKWPDGGPRPGFCRGRSTPLHTDSTFQKR
jgi:hypothetical protein